MPQRMDERKLQWFTDAIFKWLRPNSLIEREAAKKFKMSTRQARRYIKRARDNWREANPVDREALRQELCGGLRTAWQDSLKKGDHRALVLVSRALGDLYGAMQPAQINFNGTLTANVTDLTPVERERLEALDKKKNGEGA